MTDQIERGLEGVVVAASELSEIDGENGQLTYRGYPIGELARNATFEEVLYLLWEGSLPTRSQLDSFGEQLSSQREIDRAVVDTLRTLAAQDEAPMAALRTGVSIETR